MALNSSNRHEEHGNREKMKGGKRSEARIIARWRSGTSDRLEMTLKGMDGRTGRLDRGEDNEQMDIDNYFPFFDAAKLCHLGRRRWAAP